jgi:tryptophan synthase alpha chain
MTRIDKRFAQLKSENRRGLVAYLTAGYPSLEETRDLVWTVEKHGADVIELGVPFSDPIADGPVIQRATEHALARGVTLQNVLDLGAEIRRKSDIPLLLFSYFNPLLNRGLEKLAHDAANAGFDGVLAIDMAIEESDEYVRIMRRAGLNTVFLAAPTSSPERMKKIAAAATGFVYAVSRTGVTGEQQELADELKDFLKVLRTQTSSPIAVGFGISNPDQVRAVWQSADAVVVGSAIVKCIEKHRSEPDLIERVGQFTAWLRGPENEH